MRLRRLLPVAILLLGFVSSSAPLAQAEDAPRWIVAYAPAYEAVIRPLCKLRQEQGFEVVKLDVSRGLGAADVGRGLGLRLRMTLMQLCRQRPKDCCVLLVGALDGEDRATVIPPLRGRIGRMKGEPTDNEYGCLDRDRMPEVAVGRLPARTEYEARVMVEKTLAYERLASSPASADRITLLVGHPGGPTPMVRRMAAGMVEREVRTAFDRVHPRWRVAAVFHMENSPFCVPDAELGPTVKHLLAGGQLFTIYLGHSGPGGLWSNQTFLSRDDFARMDMSAGAGVLLSCGCHACEIRGRQGQGYAYAAVRNPQGPVAAIGAHGESYGALGKLAFEGLLPHLQAEDPPRRLGAWWLAMKRGIAEGRIGKLVFQLYDRADGSNGTVPLEVQRQEHLEMWMLLGDPALTLPIHPPGITLRVEGDVLPGATLVVRGRMRASDDKGTRVQVTVERPFGSPPHDLAPLPADPPEARDAALAKRYAAAHDLVLASTSVDVTAGEFETRVTIPAEVPWDRVIVRATAEDGASRGAMGLAVQR